MYGNANFSFYNVCIVVGYPKKATCLNCTSVRNWYDCINPKIKEPKTLETPGSLECEKMPRGGKTGVKNKLYIQVVCLKRDSSNYFFI